MNQPQIQPVSWYPQPSAYQQVQMTYGNRAQPQLPQMPTQMPLVGRTVNRIDEVRPQEVPMDGSVGYFPLADLSAIFARQWTGEGRIATVKYIPEPTQAPAQPGVTNEALSRDIIQRLDKIQELLNEKKAPTKRETVAKE